LGLKTLCKKSSKSVFFSEKKEVDQADGGNADPELKSLSRKTESFLAFFITFFTLI